MTSSWFNHWNKMASILQAMSSAAFLEWKKIMMLTAFLMMTSSNGNIFRVTGPLCGEFTGHRWIPHTKASDAELWCFWSAPWISGWVNNREAGDWRRHRAYYDVIVIYWIIMYELISMITFGWYPVSYSAVSDDERHQTQTPGPLFT